MADSAEPPRDAADPLHSPEAILDRAADERRREFKFRFAQSLVFGAPVLVLQWFGRALGGLESDRWVSLFQALLAGWVVYVAAAGMLSEGVLLMLARRRIPKAILADFVVATIGTVSYLTGLLRLPALMTNHHASVTPHWHLAFPTAVVLLALWTGARWWHLAKKARAKKNSAG